MTGERFFDSLVSVLGQYGTVGDRDDPKTRTRNRVLKAAAALFEQHGYRKASIDQVAREAGVAKGTVYVHFKSKAELFFHVIADEKKRLLGPFRSLFTEPMPPAVRLRRYLELVMVALTESPLSHRMMTGDRDLLVFLEELPGELRETMMAQQAIGMAWLLKGVGGYDELPEEERTERSNAFMGLLFSLGHLMEAGPRVGLHAARYAAQLARIIVDGVGAR